MASDSFIICPDCGTKITDPLFHIYPAICQNCSYDFREYYKCSLCNNYTKIKPCEICGYNPDTNQLTYKCTTCRGPKRKDSDVCAGCLDRKKSLKNLIDSIVSFSDLHKKGLIKREHFKAKVIDIVEDRVSNQITFNKMKDYLKIFKKMLNDDQIDEDIYDKISDLLLKRCEISENTQELLTKKREKTTKANKLEAKAEKLLRQKKIEKTHQIREMGETDGYLQSNKIEKPPDTHHHDKADAPSKDQTKKRVGVKIIWTIVTLFVGSIVMGLIYEFQGFGILHGLAGIGTVWVIYYIWSRL